MARPKGPTGKGRGFGSGAGKPKGYKFQHTQDKEAAREFIRTKVLGELEPLLDAQIANAKGLRHTFMREKSGKFVHLTDPKQIEDALNSGEEGKYYWTFTKDPNVPAFVSLLDRAIDKPKEQPIDVNVTDVTKRPTDELLTEASALMEKIRASR
jgi:hypothetical protein